MVRAIAKFGVLPFVLFACVETKQTQEQTGAMLQVDSRGGSDVVGFHVALTREACNASDSFSPLSMEFTIDLLDGVLPGQVSLVERRLDRSSRHLGADLFTSLPPGCYAVTASPAAEIDGETWTPSEICSPSAIEGARVVDGQTTEITLLSQCLGDDQGGLDLLVGLNHPPQLSLAADVPEAGETCGNPSTGPVACEPYRVCARVRDADDDPIELDWESPSGAHSFTVGTMELIAVDDGVRQWEQCATWVPQGPSATEIEVSAFDLAELDGRTVRFETLVSPELSRSTAELPLLAALADWGGCVDGDAVSIELPDQPCAVSGCALIDPEAYYCSGDWPVDPALRALYCDGFSMDWSTYLPTCEGGDGGDGGGDEGGDEGGDGGDDGEGPVELDCDGIDNDGDGVVDENNDHWTSYTFSRGVERAAIAGTIQATEGEWDPNTQLLRLSTRIQMSSGVNPSGLIVVLNPGDSPTGPGQAAQLFFDCNGGSPILTAYAYNGNDRYSYRDGSDRSGTQAPDPIWSSLADPSPLLEANCSLSGRDATLSFTLDAQAIQAHSPAYGSAASWSGVAFEAEYGIWMKILGNSTFRYSGDWLSSHTETKRAGIDRSNQITNPVAHCE